MPAPPPSKIHKGTKENLAKIVEAMADGRAMSISKQAQLIGASTNAVRIWMKRSNGGDPAFLVDAFGETMQFAKALTIARTYYYLELRGSVEQFALNGRERLTLFQGRPQAAYSRAALALTREEREQAIADGEKSFNADGLELDANGHVVWQTEKEFAPAGILERLLNRFGDLAASQKIDQTIKLTGAVGVGAVQLQRPNYNSGPPPVPALPLPEVEVLPSPIEKLLASVPASTVASADELNDILGLDQPERSLADDLADLGLDDEPEPELDEPEPDALTIEEPIEAEPVTEKPEPEPAIERPQTMVSEAAPATGDAPTKPIVSDLQRDLLAKLAARRAAAAKEAAGE
ncbi:hypothetical protein [Bradyrhizobium sp. USDA 4508]